MFPKRWNKLYRVLETIQFLRAIFTIEIPKSVRLWEKFLSNTRDERLWRMLPTTLFSRCKCRNWHCCSPLTLTLKVCWNKRKCISRGKNNLLSSQFYRRFRQLAIFVGHKAQCWILYPNMKRCIKINWKWNDSNTRNDRYLVFYWFVSGRLFNKNRLKYRH